MDNYVEITRKEYNELMKLKKENNLGHLDVPLLMNGQMNILIWLMTSICYIQVN